MIVVFIILGCAVLACLAVAVAYLVLTLVNPNKNRPPHIEGANGFVQAKGTNVYDGKGNLLLFKGVNLGNWFVQEYWMNVCSVGCFETGIYTQTRAERAMKANKNLTQEQIDRLYDRYMTNYIKESDFAEIAALKLNTVRIPFTFFNLTKEDGVTLRENAFQYLDWAISMCEKYGLYAILDMHGAKGSQNQDIHSGDDAQFSLYSDEQNRKATLDLWRAIAERYRNNRTVAGYDLLNETRKGYKKFTGKAQFDFYDELYRTIRLVDKNHLIFIECFTFPVHGTRIQKYGWQNVCIEYHIYNLTPLSQKTCLNFYKALHNFMGYSLPVYIGEWNAFDKDKEWFDSVKFFEKYGWSYTSWTYKTNALYNGFGVKNHCRWGLYELNISPVDLSTSTYEEIDGVLSSVGTENATKAFPYTFYEETKSNR